MSDALAIDAALFGSPIVLPPGRLHLVAGGAGAGKRSLLRQIAGLDRTAGEIRYGGEVLNRRPLAARGVRLFCPAAGQPAGDGSLDRAEAVEAQARAFAQARAGSPRVLLLDEPGAGLSAAARLHWIARLRPLLEEAVRDAVVVVATRDPRAFLMSGASLTVLAERRVIATGDALDLCINPPDLAVAEAVAGERLARLPARRVRNSVVIDDGPEFPLATALGSTSPLLTVGVFGDDVRPDRRGGDVAIDTMVLGCQFDGERSQIRLQARCGLLVMACAGLVRYRRGERLRVYIDPGALLVFSAEGQRLQAPESVDDRRQALAGVAV